MASKQEDRRELEERAKQGETVVPGGTGGGSLQAQERLAKGRRKGGERGGHAEKEGREGQEVGRPGLSTGEDAAHTVGIDVDESTG